MAGHEFELQGNTTSEVVYKFGDIYSVCMRWRLNITIYKPSADAGFYVRGGALLGEGSGSRGSPCG